MARLYFIYGTMGSSKTIQALIQRFNYMENGRKVLFLKSAIDNRDGSNVIKSRIGIEAEVSEYKNDDNIVEKFIEELKDADIVIVDEANFATKEHIEQLKYIADELDIPVYAYGLRSNFQSYLFEGSKRLMELADDIISLESICSCGNPTTINARYNDGKVVTEGELVVIGGNDQYKGICYRCWQQQIKESKE
jgi:thymidine kinase